MRRSGSAAPHSSWSPMVKATGIPAHVQLAHAAHADFQAAGDGAGVSSLTVMARSFGTTSPTGCRHG
jgi:hypothetical protein